MNTIIERLMGVDTLTDQVIAMDMLIAAKSGVHNYAVALTETASPDIREVLARQLEEAIELYGQLTDYVVRKRFYIPRDVPEQIRLDLQNAKTALAIPSP
ncbi:spore coat protein [Paenibacillus flagellatus]|uniref:Spore coat protein n=1 Tax=Paenibacillus flagellatus TaxID=2211139 RepID=A0A2V5KUP7_9BACL|nr:spore coat protein [Paenibacillus flagellatus]PYI55687.1 spore coat protein [Paenibacillus flagellatus]